jgi:hypothetical protein
MSDLFPKIPDNSFPVSPPVTKTLIATRAIAQVQSITLGISATISVLLFSDMGVAIDTRVYILEGQDYANWGSDDTYIQNYVQQKLAEEASS